MDRNSSALAARADMPAPHNERVLEYAPDSPERIALVRELDRLAAVQTELPLVIGGDEVRTSDLEPAVMPHDHAHVLARAHLAGDGEVSAAIAAATRASRDWSRTPWEVRASIFLKAADILTGTMRATLNAATMLGQSKTAHQAEIDSAAELADFWRFNVAFMRSIYGEQPISSAGVWNCVDYRPLEGFVYAATPFNFTAIAGNLPTAPALMGNTVVWKPSTTAKLSAHFIMNILHRAGLPPGVINLVYGGGSEVAQRVLSDPDFAGIHFTGSTAVFNSIWQQIGGNMSRYKTYPRIVGETGGKNFVLAHASADVGALATAVLRGAFEYQGQKCSAASRIFVPESLWGQLRARLCDEIAAIRVGDVRDFRNFMGALIDQRAWTRLQNAIADARNAPSTKVLAGGECDNAKGYFVRPTLVQVGDPGSRLMTEELFGPLAAVFVYPDKDFELMAERIDRTSFYGLTGSIFARDRTAISLASDRLRNAAGNFYVNDKPTGAVVGQQPFGGARASGTNDKAGSVWNLARWVSPRTIKETFDPPTDYRYPFMQ